MSFIKIQPKAFDNGTASQLDWSVTSYPRNGQMVQVGFTLLDDLNNHVKSDVITFGNDVVSQWNSDDSVITNAVINKLQLQLL
ncbi:MAG: hypothetical protein C0459_03495 [Chitinophaga sp.]|jgi:hypothetical protein|nr:hypothetical protein [Chitinophaga sp.]